MSKDNQPPLGGARRFALLVEAVTDYALYMLDREGRIATWNAGAQQIKGYMPDEVVGMQFSRFFTEEDQRAGKADRALRQARETGRWREEVWQVRKDGSRFWAVVTLNLMRDEVGTLVGFAAITRDISDRRKIEEALRDSERRFRLLLRGITDYALYMLDPQGHVTNWNTGAERAKGYTAEEIIGEHFSRFYTEEAQAAGEPDRALRIAANEGRHEAEGWRVRKDGSRFWAHVIIDPVYEEDGTLVGFAKITRDITKQRETQRALDEAREQLAQAQKLEAVGQITGGIAHDFNNLLTIIKGSIELALRHVEGNDRLKRLLHGIGVAADRAAGLTNQLLAFSRRQPLRPEVIGLADQLQTTGDFLDRSLRGDIQTVIDIAPDLWFVEVDPRQFELALLNVGLNARDAMPGGGTLRLTGRNVTFAEPSGGLVGDYVAVGISDTGTGIPAELLPKVVEPFFTTKDVGKGSGLGLSQAYGFAQQSGGMMKIESKPGAGTTVTFYLPARKAAARPVRLESERDTDLLGKQLLSAKISGRGAVLVVEDDPAVAELAVALLEENGYRVTLAERARAALDRLAQGEKFDLVFSDIMMPGGMNGIDLAKAIRAQYPQLPVLLATGYSEAAVSEEAQKFPLVTKPYDVRDLAARIAELMAKRPTCH